MIFTRKEVRKLYKLKTHNIYPVGIDGKVTAYVSFPLHDRDVTFLTRANSEWMLNLKLFFSHSAYITILRQQMNESYSR